MTTMSPGELTFFQRRQQAAEYFHSRFPGGIPFDGKKVLDFGSGFGGTALLAMNRGARSVLGVDLNDRRVQVATTIRDEMYPSFKDSIEFQVRDITNDTLPYQGFDLIVSESALEHVVGVRRYIEALGATLRPGGRIYIGFSGLFNSPWGDHHRLRAPLRSMNPWAHLCFPRKWLLRRVGAANLASLGLGGTSAAEYLRVLKNSGMKIVHLECNNQNSWRSRMIEPLRSVRGLNELLTCSIYTVLERTQRAATTEIHEPSSRTLLAKAELDLG